MNYIVFDLEWNQCPEGKQHENPALPFEILEIGAVKLNNEREIVDHFHEFVHPTVYRKLHHKTNEMLPFTMETLLKADPFDQVIERFRIWCGDDAQFCTWGSLDLLELQRNMRFHSIPDFLPYPLKYLDIQKLFSLAFEDGKSRRTLEYASDFLSLEKSSPFHEALSDARYTALVMGHMSDEQIHSWFSIDYFHHPKNRKEEIYTVFPTYSKFVSKEFSSKTELMRDRKVASTRCYLCGRHAKKTIRWFQSGGKNYSSLAYCPEHGYLKGKIRIKKAEDSNGFFCVKTLKLIDEVHAQEVFSRQEILRERKRHRRQAARGKDV